MLLGECDLNGNPIRRRRRVHRVVVHMSGVECGHRHKRETKQIKHVTCYACLARLAVAKRDPTARLDLEPGEEFAAEDEEHDRYLKRHKR